VDIESEETGRGELSMTLGRESGMEIETEMEKGVRIWGKEDFTMSLLQMR
jgi:hypothetical protein